MGHSTCREDAIRGRPPDQRLRVRIEQTAPLMADLRVWLETTRARIPGRSDLAAAIRYTLSRREALTFILRDGRACIQRISLTSCSKASIHVSYHIYH
jgi:hypothetical protein